MDQLATFFRTSNGVKTGSILIGLFVVIVVRSLMAKKTRVAVNSGAVEEVIHQENGKCYKYFKELVDCQAVKTLIIEER